MLKLLTTSIALSATLFAGLNEDLNEFVKSVVVSNAEYNVKETSIKDEIKLEEPKGWSAYVIELKLELLKQNNKIVTVNDTIFTDGKVISKDLISLKTKNSIKNTISPKVDPKLYDKEHLIAGTFEAPNKLLLFSDPLCPFCQDYVPEVIEFVEQNKKDFALFYYHLPLVQLHPAAMGLSKAMMAAQMAGQKDIVLKTYKKAFDIPVEDENEILNEFNSAFGMKLLTKDINKPEIGDKIDFDIQMAKNLLINGTPTIFINGKKDNTKQEYKKLAKVKK